MSWINTTKTKAYKVAHRSTVQLKHKACDQRSTTKRLYDHATLATETEGNVKESSKRNADKLPKTETDLQLVIVQESVIETILIISTLNNTMLTPNFT